MNYRKRFQKKKLKIWRLYSPDPYFFLKCCERFFPKQRYLHLCKKAPFCTRNGHFKSHDVNDFKNSFFMNRFGPYVAH